MLTYGEKLLSAWNVKLRLTAAAADWAIIDYIIIIIIIMTRRQLRSVATTLHDDRDPMPSSTPV